MLPKYTGLHPQRQALDDGVTVHFVNNELDAGPVVLQRPVLVLRGDTAETPAARILDVKHTLYPEAMATVLNRG